jgi:hypothetical protein
MPTLLSRIRALFRHSRLDEDLGADIRAHLDLLEADYVTRGATPEAALWPLDVRSAASSR